MGGMTEWRKPQPAVQAPVFMIRPTLLGSVSDSASSLIVRGSISRSPDERASCIRRLALLGSSASSRLAFKKALRSAAEESIDLRQFSKELSNAVSRPVAEAFFGASLDCLKDGDFLLSRAAGDIGSALARNLGEESLGQATAGALGLLGNPRPHVREAASRILVSLSRHPLADAREIAELAYDSGTIEGRKAAEIALLLPQKVIDMKADSFNAA